MDDYWLGISVGWLIGICVAGWLYRDLVKNLKKQILHLEDHIRKFT